MKNFKEWKIENEKLKMKNWKWKIENEKLNLKIKRLSDQLIISLNK